MTRALGRAPSRRDPRTLRLARYLAPNVPLASPPARDWTHPAQAPRWGMWRNDVLGCCTCAAIAHALQAAAANTHHSLALTDADVVELYSAAGGYEPGRPETDQGAQMIDVLRLMRGRGMAGVTVGAYVAVDWTNRLEVEAAINLTGSLYVGLDLPTAWQTATTWDVAPANADGPTWDRNSWGGHAVAVLAYDRVGLTSITWGAPKFMTWEAVRKYGGEAWCFVDALWLRDDGLTPSGFNAELLAQDLAAIGAVG